MEGVGTLVASRELSLSPATTQARPLVTSRRTTTIASSALRSSAGRKLETSLEGESHVAAAGDKLEAPGGDRLGALLRGRPGTFARHPWRQIQESLPIVRSHTPAKHRASGASSGELAYLQLTPAETLRSLVGRRTHQEDSPRCSSRTAQLTQWLQQLRLCGPEKLLLDLIAAEDPTPPRTPALKHTRARNEEELP